MGCWAVQPQWRKKFSPAKHQANGGRNVFVCFSQSLFATTRMCLPPLGCAFRTLISARTWRLRKQSVVGSSRLVRLRSKLCATVFERPPQPSRQRKAAEFSATRRAAQSNECTSDALPLCLLQDSTRLERGKRTN